MFGLKFRNQFSLLLAGLYLFNRLFEGHVCTMSGGNHLPRHNHIPFVGNYFFIPIAVNPAPAIIQFKSHVPFIYNI